MVGCGDRRGRAPNAAFAGDEAQLIGAGAGCRVAVPDQQQVTAVLLVANGRAPIGVRTRRERSRSHTPRRGIGWRNGHCRPGRAVPSRREDVAIAIHESDHPLCRRRVGSAGHHLDACAHVGAGRFGIAKGIVAVRVEQTIAEGVVVVVINTHASSRDRILARLARQRHVRAIHPAGVGAAAYVGRARGQRIDDAHVLQHLRAGIVGVEREVQLLARRGVSQIDRLAQHRHEGEVRGQVVLTGGQGDVELADGGEIAARQVRVIRVHLDAVVARPQGGEQIGPVRAAAGSRRQHAVQIQIDGNVGQRRLACVIDAIAVAIDKDLVANGARLHPPETKVGVVVGSAEVGNGLWIGGRYLERSGAEVGQQRWIGGSHVGGIVEALGQAGEAVQAVGVCDGGGYQCVSRGIDDTVAVGVLVKGDGHAGDADVSAGIEDAVVGDVFEDLVADDARAHRLVAKVGREVLLVGGQVDGMAVVERAVGIAGLGGARQRRAVVDFHHIGACQQAGEEVVAVGVGGGGGQQGHAVSCVELDGDAGDAFFTRILHAIAVPVAPDRVADLAAAHGDAGQRAGGQGHTVLGHHVAVAVAARRGCRRNLGLELDGKLFLCLNGSRDREDGLAGIGGVDRRGHQRAVDGDHRRKSGVIGKKVGQEFAHGDRAGGGASADVSDQHVVDHRAARRDTAGAHRLRGHQEGI